ncbi:MAG: hypothetical protein KY410_04780, partial [Proteobacteria bacterium]|nr:hypothetical protein [Pseudomonadota bacterium]
MATYLLSWDPTKWDWRTIKEQSEQVARGTPVIRQWSCGSNRRIFNGDIVYFIRQGREPRGLFARGEVVRGSYEAMDVDVQDANRGRGTLVIDVRLVELENAVEHVVLPKQALAGSGLGKFVWDIRESGAKIPDDIAGALDKAWRAASGTAATSGQPVEAEPVESKPSSPEHRKKITESPAAKAAAPTAEPSPGSDSAEAEPSLGSDSAEQARLKQEREAKLQKIREREAGERRTREAMQPQEAQPAPVPMSEARRNEVLVQNYFIMLDAELQG